MVFPMVVRCFVFFGRLRIFFCFAQYIAPHKTFLYIPFSWVNVVDKFHCFCVVHVSDCIQALISLSQSPLRPFVARAQTSQGRVLSHR